MIVSPVGITLTFICVDLGHSPALGSRVNSFLRILDIRLVAKLDFERGLSAQIRAVDSCSSKKLIAWVHCCK